MNDENKDLKNNRLELLQILCSTFNSFVDFSKLGEFNAKIHIQFWRQKIEKNKKNSRNILGVKGI